MMLGQHKLNNLIVRAASEEDAVALYEIEKYWAEIPGHLVSTASELRPASYSNMAVRLNSSPNSIHLVALVERKVVGHALVEEGGLLAINHIGRLSITVCREHINKGIGSHLLESILVWARNESQLKKIELLVRSTNKNAIDLYQKFGFKEEGRILNRIQVGPGVFVDDLMMGLWLEIPKS